MEERVVRARGGLARVALQLLLDLTHLRDEAPVLGPGVALLHIQPPLLHGTSDNGDDDNNNNITNVSCACACACAWSAKIVQRSHTEGERGRTRGLRASWMGFSSPMTRSATDSRRALRRLLPLLPFSDSRFFLAVANGWKRAK
jgi:hypothetical protein